MTFLNLVFSIIIIQFMAGHSFASAGKCLSAHVVQSLDVILAANAPKLKTSQLDFQVKTDQLAESKIELGKKIDALKEDIASLQLQLSPAEAQFRRLQDPRRFASWGLRRDSTNLYTQRLNNRLKNKNSLQATLSAVLAEVVDISKLKEIEYSALSTPDKAIYQWLMNRLNSLFLELITPQSFLSGTEKAQAAQLKDDYRLFFSSSHNDRSKLLLQAQRDLKIEQTERIQDQLKALSDDRDAKKMIESLSQKVALSPEEVVALEKNYQEILKSFSVQDEQYDWGSMFQTSHVLYLAKEAWALGIPGSKMAAEAKQFYVTLRNLSHDYPMDMTALASMMPIAMKRNISQENVLERYVNFVDLLTRSGRYKEWKLHQMDIAQMTVLSFETGKSPSVILEAYDRILLYGRVPRTDQHYNELSNFELAGLSIRWNRSAKAVIEDYRIVLEFMRTRNENWTRSDVPVIRILQLAERFNLPLRQVLNLADQLQKTIPNISPLQIIGFIELALSAKVDIGNDLPKVGSLLTEEEMNVAKIYLWDYRIMSGTEWLYHVHLPYSSGSKNLSSYPPEAPASNMKSEPKNIVSLVQLGETGKIINMDGSEFTPR